MKPLWHPKNIKNTCGLLIRTRLQIFKLRLSSCLKKHRRGFNKVKGSDTQFDCSEIWKDLNSFAVISKRSFMDLTIPCHETVVNRNVDSWSWLLLLIIISQNTQYYWSWFRCWINCESESRIALVSCYTWNTSWSVTWHHVDVEANHYDGWGFIQVLYNYNKVITHQITQNLYTSLMTSGLIQETKCSHIEQPTN